MTTPWYNKANQSKKSDEEKFWEKVDIRSKDECWEWLAATNSGGYGQCRINQIAKQAHRVSWEWFHGISSQGLNISSICKNKLCVNPYHLYSTIDHRFLDVEARFLLHIVHTNTCWNWIGFTDKDGYGQFSFNGNTIAAHRFSYEFYIGEIKDELFVCHSCDNPSCVNPAHLFLGTQADNMKDMYNKGRRKSDKGENNPQSKLTEKDVLNIRELYVTGEYKQGKLAKIFNTSRSNISFIVNNKRWKHI